MGENDIVTTLKHDRGIKTRIIISYNHKMTPTDLLLIGLIVLVLLLVYYFMGRKRTPIEIPQEIAVAALKPPKRPLEIFIDPNVGSQVKIVSLSTVEELDKVLDDIVEVNMADRNAINEEATKLEERIIADQKDNVQDLKTASEIIIVEKKEELSASQKLLAERKRKHRKESCYFRSSVLQLMLLTVRRIV